MRSNILLARAAILLVLLLTALTATASPFLQTVAWNQTIGIGTAFLPYGTIDVDGAGNLYSLSSKVYGTNNFGLNITRYDSAGRVSLAKSIYLGDNVSPDRIIAPSSGTSAASFFYVVAFYKNIDTYVSKFTSDGTQVWYKILAASNYYLTPAGADADTSGNLYLAIQNDFNISTHKLEMIEYGPNGTVLHDVSHTNIEPLDAHREGPNWVATGVDQMNTDSARWGLYNWTTGVNSAGGFAQRQTEGATYTDYWFYAFPQPGNTTLLIKNSQSYMNTNLSQMQFNLNNLNASGGIVWTSAVQPGNAQQVASGGPSGPIYVMSFQPILTRLMVQSNYYLQGFSSAGASQWTDNLPQTVIYPMVADSRGVFTFQGGGASQQNMLARQYSPAGAVQWTSTQVSGGSDRSNMGGQALVNGTLYWAANIATGPGSPAPYETIVQKCVPGVSFVSLTAPTSVQSGHTISIAVHLNAVATSAVTVNLVSTYSKLLFANNTQSMTLVIPAGYSVANVAVHALAVGGPDHADVVGTSNTVSRSIHILINP
jgi:hypothetical protein